MRRCLLTILFFFFNVLVGFCDVFLAMVLGDLGGGLFLLGFSRVLHFFGVTFYTYSLSFDGP